MPTPTAETPPHGLDAYWLGVWRHALKVLKKQGTWAWEQRPLLDEYVFAMIAAADARDEGEHTVWDRHSKRAARLADILILTPEARRRNGITGDDQAAPQDPFEEFDDQLAKQRAKRSA